MRLQYRNIALEMAAHSHGTHTKNLIVLHETISRDIPGWQDIENVLEFLAARDYGIHGMTDREGRVAWARGLGQAIFWHAGGVNAQAIGIEQVSDVPLRSPTNPGRRALWAARTAQIRATARLVAAISNSHGIPLVQSVSIDPSGWAMLPGVTSHWQVSQYFPASEGHTDCWPIKSGGYYPLNEVIWLARRYKALGYTLT